MFALLARVKIGVPELGLPRAWRWTRFERRLWVDRNWRPDPMWLFYALLAYGVFSLADCALYVWRY